MPITVDRRFFLTHFVANTEDLRKRARNRMMQPEREKAIVLTIVLHEVYKFVYENVGKDVAELRVELILKSNFAFIELNSQIALSSARLKCRYRVLPTAGSIIATIELKSTRVLVDDPHFKEIREIRTEWI